MTETSDLDNPAPDVSDLVPDSYVTTMATHGLTDPVLFIGFLSAPVALATKWRLYTTLDLDAYIEFEHGAVLHRVECPIGPGDGSIVWLQGDTLITIVYGELQETIKAKILSGDVLGKFAWWWPSKTCPRSYH